MDLISTSNTTVLSDFNNLATKSVYLHENGWITDFQVYKHDSVFLEVNKNSCMLDVMRVKDFEMECVHRFPIPQLFCVACAKRSEGEVALGGDNGFVKLYNNYETILSCESINISNRHDRIVCLDYNCTDEYIASLIGSGEIILYSTTKPTEMRNLNGNNSTFTRFHPSRSYCLAMGSGNGSVTVYDINGEKEIFTYINAHTTPCSDLGMSIAMPDMLISTGYDCGVNMFDTRQKSLAMQLKGDHPYTTGALSSCGTYLALGNVKGELKSFDMRSLKTCLALQKMHAAPVTRLSFLPHCKLDTSCEKSDVDESQSKQEKSYPSLDSDSDFLDYHTNKIHRLPKEHLMTIPSRLSKSSSRNLEAECAKTTKISSDSSNSPHSGNGIDEIKEHNLSADASNVHRKSPVNDDSISIAEKVPLRLPNSSSGNLEAKCTKTTKISSDSSNSPHSGNRIDEITKHILSADVWNVHRKSAVNDDSISIAEKVPLRLPKSSSGNLEAKCTKTTKISCDSSNSPHSGNRIDEIEKHILSADVWNVHRKSAVNDDSISIAEKVPLRLPKSSSGNLEAKCTKTTKISCDSSNSPHSGNRIDEITKHILSADVWNVHRKSPVNVDSIAIAEEVPLRLPKSSSGNLEAKCTKTTKISIDSSNSPHSGNRIDEIEKHILSADVWNVHRKSAVNDDSISIAEKVPLRLPKSSSGNLEAKCTKTTKISRDSSNSLHSGNRIDEIMKHILSADVWNVHRKSPVNVDSISIAEEVPFRLPKSSSGHLEAKCTKTTKILSDSSNSPHSGNRIDEIKKHILSADVWNVHRKSPVNDDSISIAEEVPLRSPKSSSGHLEAKCTKTTKISSDSSNSPHSGNGIDEITGHILSADNWSFRCKSPVSDDSISTEEATLEEPESNSFINAANDDLICDITVAFANLRL